MREAKVSGDSRIESFGRVEELTHDSPVADSKLGG